MDQPPEQPPSGQWAPAPSPGAPAPGQWAPPAPPPAPETTNGLAIASLICGIVWAGGLLSLLALIFGIVALTQISRRGGRGRGMAIAGTVLGGLGVLLTGLAVLVLFIAADRIGDDIDVDRPASVVIETSSPEVCWEAELLSGRRLREGRVDDIERGCGPARFELGRGFVRFANVHKTRGEGTLSVTFEIDGVVRDSGTTDGDEELVVTPFDRAGN